MHPVKPLHIGIVFVSLNHAIFSGMRLAVALAAINLQASPLVVGMVTATFAVLPMLGSIHLGRYVDRHGGRSLNLICVILLACAALLASFVPHVAALAVAGLVVGGAFMTTHLMNQQMVGQQSKPENRTANFALAATGIAASATLSPLLTGLAIDHVGFNWAFLLLALLPLLSMQFVLFRKLPELKPRPVPAKAVPQGKITDLLRDPKLRHIYLINVVFAASWDIFLFMTPLYGASLEISASQIGLIISCFSGATFAIRLFAAPISRRFSAWQIMLICMVINGASSLMFGLVGIVPLMMVFAFTMGLGHGLANPTTNTLLYETAPPGRTSEVIGLRTSAGMSLQVMLPMMAGALGALIGIAPLFWFIAALQIGSAYASRSNWHAPGRTKF